MPGREQSEGDEMSARGRCLAVAAVAGLILWQSTAGIAESGPARSASAQSTKAETDSSRVRESATELSAIERRRFVSGLLALKRTPSPYPQDRDRGLSWYDTFVNWHLMLSDCQNTDLNTHPRMQGHAGPMFLPWHRQYVLLLEDALRKVTRSPITVPYWDWTDHSSVAKVFTTDFMGPNGNPERDYALDSGAFTPESWPLIVKSRGEVNKATATTPYVVRDMGRVGGTPTPPLPTTADVAAAFAAPAYDVAPYDDSSDPAKSFRNALEGYKQGGGPSQSACVPDRPGTDQGTMDSLAPGRAPGLHNAVHGWVGGLGLVTSKGVLSGGTMFVNDTSPNDPIFFLHHSNIDRLWAQWQAANPRGGYQPADGSYPFNGLHDEMYPFNVYGIHVTPADVMNIRSLNYSYPRPKTDRLGMPTGSEPASGSVSLAGLVRRNDWVCRRQPSTDPIAQGRPGTARLLPAPGLRQEAEGRAQWRWTT
jgi:tyrosinase